MTVSFDLKTLKDRFKRADRKEGPELFGKHLHSYNWSDCTFYCCLVQLFATPWTVAHQGPLSLEFSKQEYWSGLPFPSPGTLPNPGTEPRSLALQADSYH